MMKKQLMKHRHIDVVLEEGLPIESIDDIISRGDMKEWLKLREYIMSHDEVINDILKVSEHYIKDPYEQKYYFWHNLALKHKKL